MAERQQRWAGSVEPGFERLANEFARLIGNRRGGALAVYRGEKQLVDVWAGTADRAGRRPWTANTPSLSFSTTKGVTSTVLHVLADRGLIGYDEPVAAFWPEFAARGKGDITVRQLMSHAAALHELRGLVERGTDLLDHVKMSERLAAAPTAWAPGPSGYHAFTYGWLADGLARSVTGRGVADLLTDEIVTPFGLDGLHIGRPPSPPAVPYGRSVPAFSLAGTVTGPLLSRARVTKAAYNAFAVPGVQALFEGSDPAIWTTQMPAVNGAFTARGLGRLYAFLANGGEVGGQRLLSPETVHELGRVQIRTNDRVLGIKMRWRLGYHQAFGAGSHRAFGHFGWGGSGAWADPDSGLSFGFVTNDVRAWTTPIGGLVILRLGRLATTLAGNTAPTV